MRTRPEYAQVYDPDGKYVGFFQTREGAELWVDGREGYEISDRRPSLKERM